MAKSWTWWTQTLVTRKPGSHVVGKASLQFQDSEDEISKTSNNFYSKAHMPSELLTDSFPRVLRQALKGSRCWNIFMFLIIKGTTSVRSQLTEHAQSSLISPEPSKMYQALGVFVFVLFFVVVLRHKATWKNPIRKDITVTKFYYLEARRAK